MSTLFSSSEDEREYTPEPDMLKEEEQKEILPTKRTKLCQHFKALDY